MLQTFSQLFQYCAHIKQNITEHKTDEVLSMQSVKPINIITCKSLHTNWA